MLRMIYGENKESLIQKYLHTNLNQNHDRFYSTTVVSPLRLNREHNLGDTNHLDKSLAIDNFISPTIKN